MRPIYSESDYSTLTTTHRSANVPVNAMVTSMQKTPAPQIREGFMLGIATRHPRTKAAP